MCFIISTEHTYRFDVNIAVLHFAVKLNCLVKVILCLDGFANCLEKKYTALEKSVKSTDKKCNMRQL